MIDPARAQADRELADRPLPWCVCGHHLCIHAGSLHDGSCTACACLGFKQSQESWTQPKPADRPARSPQEPPQDLELGPLLDLLDEAATLIDEGRVAESESLKCVYREVIHEAIARLRAAALPVPPQPDAIVAITQQFDNGAETFTREDMGVLLREYGEAWTAVDETALAYPECGLARAIQRLREDIMADIAATSAASTRASDDGLPQASSTGARRVAPSAGDSERLLVSRRVSKNTVTLWTRRTGEPIATVSGEDAQQLASDILELFSDPAVTPAPQPPEPTVSVSELLALQDWSQREVAKSTGREGFDRLVLRDDVLALVKKAKERAAAAPASPPDLEDPFRGELSIYRHDEFVMGINAPFVEGVLAAIRGALPPEFSEPGEDS